MNNHVITETRSPIAVTANCSCGWYHRETRRQNALARNSKMNRAISKHLKEVTETMELSQ